MGVDIVPVDVHVSTKTCWTKVFRGGPNVLLDPHMEGAQHCSSLPLCLLLSYTILFYSLWLTLLLSSLFYSIPFSRLLSLPICWPLSLLFSVFSVFSNLRMFECRLTFLISALARVLPLICSFFTFIFLSQLLPVFFIPYPTLSSLSLSSLSLSSVFFSSSLSSSPCLALPCLALSCLAFPPFLNFFSSIFSFPSHYSLFLTFPLSLFPLSFPLFSFSSSIFLTFLPLFSFPFFSFLLFQFLTFHLLSFPYQGRNLFLCYPDEQESIAIVCLENFKVTGPIPTLSPSPSPPPLHSHLRPLSTPISLPSVHFISTDFPTLLLLLSFPALAAHFKCNIKTYYVNLKNYLCSTPSGRIHHSCGRVDAQRHHWGCATSTIRQVCTTYSQ